MEQALKAGWALPALDRSSRDRLWIGLFLLAAVAFLFVDLRTVPIILWDESRNAVNALEMRLTGFSLVTTFEGQADHWNTKPPLLIWAMTASMQLFGPTEFALRLPVAIAALATIVCLILFVRRGTGSLATALLAAAILVLSPGFFGEHGARTGDYDVPLLLFATAGLQLLFFAVHRAKPSLALMAAVGACVALGALTKTIAAFIPFAGAALYFLANKRWPRLLSEWRRTLIATAIAVVPLVAYYAVRGVIDPGYLDAIRYNDMGGRFSEAITGEPTTPAYYALELLRGWFFAGPLLLAIPLAFRQVRGKSRQLLIYSLFVGGTTLLVFSISSTRLIHYALPIFPWFAIAVAISLRTLIGNYLVAPYRAGQKTIPLVYGLLLLALTVQLTARSAQWRYEGFPARQFPAQAAYGDAFRQLFAQGIKAVTVVDPGLELGDRDNYQPIFRAYQLIWAEKGLAVERVVFMPATAGDRVLLSCEPETPRFWNDHRTRALGQCGVIFPAT